MPHDLVVEPGLYVPLPTRVISDREVGTGFHVKIATTTAAAAEAERGRVHW